MSRWGLLGAGFLLLLAGCAAKPPAPVVERSSAPPRAELPVDGLHQVYRGDTLHGIAFKYGLDWRELARWNDLNAPYIIYPDQVLRLRAPAGAARRPAGTVSTRGVQPRSSSTRADAAATKPRTPAPASSSRPAPVAAKPAPKAAAPKAAPAKAQPKPVSSTGWMWPVEGRVLRSFKAGDPARNGLDIASREGREVVAAGAGEGVYSGNGLIGYGELVIIKHDDRMLSAYGHNRVRLVKEGDVIAKGQKIAEVGRNDRKEQILHFEIRRDGKPVDPMRYLPKR